MTYTAPSAAKSSIDLAGRRIAIYPLSNGGFTGEDFDYLKSVFAVLLGELKDSDGAKILELAKILVEDGWSTERLNQTARRFKRTFEAYGSTWTPAKFLECSPENDLYDQEWYNGLSDSDHEHVECWMSPDKKCLYRVIGTGVKLPKEFTKIWP